MEKLLRDLNIYAHSFMKCNLTFTYDGNIIRVQGDEIGPYVAESIILNKKFGFIEWLVDYDKIDFEGKLNTLRFESLVDQTLDSYLALLMLLAIQDEPIRFLCEIIK